MRASTTSPRPSSRRKRSCSLTRSSAHVKKAFRDGVDSEDSEEDSFIDDDEVDGDDDDDDDDDEAEASEVVVELPPRRVVPWAPHNATIAQHFVLLTQLSNTLRAEFACAQANMEKNRYANVLANEETRVKLASGAYVNANLCANGRFIATQAPLPDTLEDFWTMVLEQKSRVIVCLTKFEANRASNYMPELGRSTRVGRIAVHTRGAVQYGDDLIVRYLLVQHDADAAPRGVIHLQYTAWPDFGVPDSSEPVVRLYAIMRAFHSKLASSPEDDRAPFICHCSAGIGRAGTFIAASTLIEQVVDGSLQTTPAPSSPSSSSSSSVPPQVSAAAAHIEHCDSTTMRQVLAHRAFVESVVSSIDVTAPVDPALLGDVPSSPLCASGGGNCCGGATAPPAPPAVTVTAASESDKSSSSSSSSSSTQFADWARGASISPPSSPAPVVCRQQQQQAEAKPQVQTCFLSHTNSRHSLPVESSSEPPSPQLLSAVFQTVLNLRKARRGCVQTCAQYQYIVTLVNTLTQHVAALRLSLSPSSSPAPSPSPSNNQSNANANATSHITVL